MTPRNSFSTVWSVQVKDEEQEAAKFDAVFPCILRILPACVFNKKDPIIVGVDIEEGIAKVSSLATPFFLAYCELKVYPRWRTPHHLQSHGANPACK